MRRPQYLSPTSISTWVKDPAEFYLRYMSDTPPPKEPQNKHMAVGASFDAFVKHYLTTKIFGERPGMGFKDIYEGQVEHHNRDSFLKTGEYIFDWYRRLGSLDSLMAMLGKTRGAPRFEMDARGEATLGHSATLGGVPFRVKPDLFFETEHGARIILDWKVNGFFSSSGVSPNKGYVSLREDGKMPSGHADAQVRAHLGIFINYKAGIEAYSEEWARQLAIGAWLCGEPVGAQFVGLIHQIVCRPGGREGMPRVRVAEHAGFVSEEFQARTHELAAQIWTTINSDHVFKHLSKEESIARCTLLDGRRDVGEAHGIESPALDMGGFQWQQ